MEIGKQKYYKLYRNYKYMYDGYAYFKKHKYILCRDRYYYNGGYHINDDILNISINTMHIIFRIAYYDKLVLKMEQDNYNLLLKGNYRMTFTKLGYNDENNYINILLNREGIIKAYYGNNGLIYTITRYNLAIYYRCGAKFCDIDYNCDFQGIKDKATFYYPSGVIIREYIN